MRSAGAGSPLGLTIRRLAAIVGDQARVELAYPRGDRWVDLAAVLDDTWTC